MKHNSPTCFIVLHVTLAFAAGLPILASALAPNQVSYDLVNDWSDTQNPNGVWSYNYNGVSIDTHQTFWWGEAGWGFTYIGDGSIIKGSQPTGVSPFGDVATPAHDWQPGDVMMHALSIPYGGSSTFLNVTWTSPANGTIGISGKAWDGEIASDRDVAWSLLVGGQGYAGRSSTYGLYRTDTDALFNSNLTGYGSLDNSPVTRGEVVEFLVATDTYYGHFVGVQENITLTIVPEPGAGQLFIAGIADLRLLRRSSLGFRLAIFPR